MRRRPPDSATRQDRRQDRSLYRRLLSVLPFEFRSEFGDDMEEAFGDIRQDTESRRWGRLRLWWIAATDLLRTAPGEHADVLRQDFRFSLRQLRRSPQLTAAALATLVLGVGVHTAAFSLVSHTLLDELPFVDPNGLAMVWSTHPDHDGGRSQVSLQAFEALRDSGALESIAVWSTGSGNLTGGENPERVRLALVSDRLFSTLGVRPALGRDFLPGEDRPGQTPAAVVSHGFFARRLGADPAAIGEPVTLDGQPVTVIGVLPPDFLFPGGGEPELYRTLGLAGDDAGVGKWLVSVARLAPGSSPTAAEEALAAVAAGLHEQGTEPDAGWTFELQPLQAAMVGDLASRLWILLALAGLVVAIACANLASLYLARGSARESELAVRAALGARRLRVVRQLLTESVVLGGLGAALSLPVAAVVLRAVHSLGSTELQRGATGLDLRSAVACFATALAVSVLAAVPSALRAARTATSGSLASGERAGGDPHGVRRRSALVALEVAAALVVLVAAGLLLRSLLAAADLDPGVDRERLLVARIEPPMNFAPENDSMEAMIRAYEAEMTRAAQLYDGLFERIEALPGVEAAGAVNRRPLVDGWNSTFAAESRQAPEPPLLGNERVVTPGYFDAAGIELTSGRGLRSSDASGAPRAAVVSRSLADALWPDEPAVGRRLTGELPVTDDTVWYTVVGVVENVRVAGLEAPPPPTLYRTVAQARGGFFQDLGMDLVLRTSGDPISLVPALRRAVREVDPDLPVFAVATMDEALSDQIAPRRALTLLVLAFAALSAALAAVGVFGVLAYSVSLRRREIGIRMALGARRQTIVGHVVRGGMATVAFGLAAGLVAAAFASRALESQLFGIAPFDLPTYLAVAALLGLVGLLASWLPARRAARTEPTRALTG